MASSNDIQDMEMHEPNPFDASYDEVAEDEEEEDAEDLYECYEGDTVRPDDTGAEFGDVGENSPLLAGHGRVERDYECSLVGWMWRAARCLLCCSSESSDFK